MKKHRVKRSVSLTVVFALAVILLMFSTVGGARVALTYYSQTYTSEFEMYDIGITLLENGNPVHQRNYDQDKRAFVVAGDETLLSAIDFKYGETYPEALTVQNTGTIDEYVRVTVRKYWVDGKNKRTDLDPALIRLKLTEGNGWVRDPQYSSDTTERVVLYYTTPLAKGAVTPAFTESISVDPAVKAAVESSVTKTEEIDGKTYTTITTTYTYNGLKFCLEVEADGVQTHNAADAIRSAWGRQVSVAADGTLSLK